MHQKGVKKLTFPKSGSVIGGATPRLGSEHNLSIAPNPQGLIDFMAIRSCVCVLMLHRMRSNSLGSRILRHSLTACYATLLQHGLLGEITQIWSLQLRRLEARIVRPHPHTSGLERKR